ncbi:zinc-dependent metalloprotease [soil metagenome]
MARLIDPWIARAVARRLAGDAELMDSHLVERLAGDLADLVPRSEELVAEASGIPRPSPVRWRLIDRAAWSDANITGLGALLAPLAEKAERRLKDVPWPVRVAQRAAVSIEVGVLLGYVSRRVLGQFDLLVADQGADEGGMLLFVAPNIIDTERRLGFVPEDFTLWVALHEVAHRFQFDGVPWLRGRFMALLHSYVAAIDLETRDLTRRLAQAGRRLMDRSTPPEERSPAYLFASPEQRATLDQLQALMTVVEGHGNFVMDLVGEQVIPSWARMRHAFERRRREMNRLQRALSHVLGLELKLRQYEVGKAFCDALYAVRGREGLSMLWAAPDNLPTLPELRAPDRWLQRMHA